LSWPDLSPLPELEVKGGSVDAFTVSPDSRLLVAGLYGGAINIWDLTNREPQAASVLLAEEHIVGVGFVQSSNQTKLTSISSDKTVRLWDTLGENKEPVLRLGTPALAVGISPDSSYLATVVRTPTAPNGKTESGSFTLQLRDLKTSRQISSTTFGGVGLNPRIFFAPNGQEVAVTDFGRLEFYKLPSLELEASHGERGLVYAPDGSWLAYLTERGVIKRTSLNAPEKVLVPHRGNLQQLAVSPDGRTLVGCEQFGAKIFFWDTRDGHQLGPPLSGHTLRIIGLSVCADGKTLVSAGWDGRLGIWDMSHRQNRAFLRGHNNCFNQAVVSPDGGTIATCGDDSAVRLWNVACRQEIAVLEGHSDLLNDVAFSADGRWLASASNDGTVRLWHAPLMPEIEVEGKQTEGQ
jgi:WD40 repeat protein